MGRDVLFTHRIPRERLSLLVWMQCIQNKSWPWRTKTTNNWLNHEFVYLLKANNFVPANSGGGTSACKPANIPDATGVGIYFSQERPEGRRAFPCISHDHWWNKLSRTWNPVLHGRQHKRQAATARDSHPTWLHMQSASKASDVIQEDIQVSFSAQKIVGFGHFWN